MAKRKQDQMTNNDIENEGLNNANPTKTSGDPEW